MADRIALIGSETLLGREIEDVLARSANRPLITPYASNAEGNFGAQDGEAIFVEPLNVESMRDQAAIVIAGTAEGAGKAYSLAKEASSSPPQLIDGTGYLESKPEARIGSASGSWLTIVPHPAAFAISSVLEKLAGRWPIVRSLAHIFEPASEQSQKGIQELQQQTSGLLSFKALEKKVYDAQLSFNLLSRYGDEAPVKLSSIEQRIERHVATLLHQHQERDNVSSPPMPSLRLIQAPVFHGYSISLWVEFQADFKVADISGALAASEEPPTNVGIAGQSGFEIGDIRTDRNNAHAVWFWIALDNLRVRAEEISRLLGASQKTE